MFHLVSYWLFQDNPISNINRFELQEMGILLEAIFGGSYSIPFGDGLVTVKPQPVTSNPFTTFKNSFQN